MQKNINNHIPMKNDIGSKIREFRKRAGMSQLELELSIGAAQGSMSRIESGKVNPTKETLVRIIDILQLTERDAASLFDIPINDKLASIISTAQKITSTFELEQILQTAVNDIVYELNLLGALIGLVDPETDLMHAHTYTQNWYTALVDRLMGKKISNLTIPLTEDMNLLIRCYLTNTPQYSEQLADFAVPALSKITADMIQRVINQKSSIALPLSQGENKLGVIYFSKNIVDDFEQDLDILKSFTSYLATTIKNAQQYKNLQNQMNERNK